MTNVMDLTRDPAPDDHEHLCVGAASLLLAKATGPTPGICKRADLQKMFAQAMASQGQPQPVSSRLFADLITKTARYLNRIYDLKLVEVPRQQYILVANKEQTTNENPTDKNHTILVASLAHIFMSGGQLKEDLLWKFLSEADLLPIDDLTTRRNLMNYFTKHMYLNHVKIGEERFAFEWGPRADAEMPKGFLLTKIANALERPVDHWAEQHRTAFKIEIEADRENSILID